MRPGNPQITGTLYRPTAIVACGTATAADDSRCTSEDKEVMRE
jgi:hypothetical protein